MFPTPAQAHEDFAEEVMEFLSRNPGIQRVEVLYSGFYGGLRGKWLPVDALSNLVGHGIRLPTSTVALDVWSEDVPKLGLAIERGDPDSQGVPVAGSLVRVPWATQPTAQMLVTLYDPTSDEPGPLEPRHVLQKVQEGWRAHGLTPVVATEMEFYLVDMALSDAGHPQPPMPPGWTDRLSGGQVYDMDVVDAFAVFLTEVTIACKAQGVPADTVIAEYGTGQFEVNLTHESDALMAADHCLMLKRIVKAVAIKHGFRAVFMAKPYTDQPGNGLHVHASALNTDGENVFSGEVGEANAALGHAIGGLLRSMPELQLLFAPHANSYRRFQPRSFAPVTPCWGHDNRNAAVRLPTTAGPGARFEHRVAGADANPYLTLAAILAGALQGIKDELAPGDPVVTMEGIEAFPPLAREWTTAIDAFAKSDLAATSLGTLFRDVYATSAVAEQERIATEVTDMEICSYLRRT